MPKFAKGSAEAKAWGEKMKKARESKKSIKGGFLEPGEMPLNQLEQPKQKAHNLNMQLLASENVEGGKLKNPFKKLEKGLWKAQDVMSQANPFGNKQVRQAGIKAGEVTTQQLLPAVTQAGLPLFYASAGLAGAMLGGPVGAVAATRGAQMLYDEMVAKKGYDPRTQQKSEILKAVSSEAGKQGASELKSSALVSKGKGLKKRGRPKKGMKTMLRGKPVILIEGGGPIFSLFEPNIELMIEDALRDNRIFVRDALARIVHDSPELSNLERYNAMVSFYNLNYTTDIPGLGERLRQETNEIVQEFINAVFPPRAGIEYPIRSLPKSAGA